MTTKTPENRRKTSGRQLLWLALFSLLCGCAPGRHHPHRLPALFAPENDARPKTISHHPTRSSSLSGSKARASKTSSSLVAHASAWSRSNASLWQTNRCSGLPTKVGKSQKRKVLRVMSFNVNYGGDIDKALRAIANSQADVVALQETTSDWPLRAKKALGKSYANMLFFQSPGAGGMGFLSRYRIASQRRLSPQGGGWFQAWLLKVETPLGKISFLNVHLRPPLGEDGRLSSIPAAYFATRGIRRKELQAHMAHIAPLASSRRSRLCGEKRRPKGCLPPTIVLGDFNENRQGFALRWLRKKRGMKSALQRFDRTSPTWHWPTRWWTFRDRLDHVMYSAHLQATAAKVLPAAGSDHFPLLATLVQRCATGTKPAR